MRVRGKDAEPLTIGTRAASKLLVEVLAGRADAAAPSCRRLARSSRAAQRAGAGAVCDHRQLVPGRRGLQPGAARLPEHRRCPARRGRRRVGPDLHAGMAGAVDEAPALVHGDARQRRRRDRRRRHAAQLSLSAARGGPGPPGDVAARLAGRADRRRGARTRARRLGHAVQPAGQQAGRRLLPARQRRADLVAEPADRSLPVASASRRAKTSSIVNPFLAGSAIYRVRPMFNLMLESVVDWRDDVVGPSTTERDTAFIISPGARGGWNIGDKQIVVGAGAAGHAASAARPSSACSATSRTSCRSSRQSRPQTHRPSDPRPPRSASSAEVTAPRRAAPTAP